ncbi:MAG: hypothetical protein WCY08_14510, partial [Rhodocyclaceae bacterium]
LNDSVARRGTFLPLRQTRIGRQINPKSITRRLLEDFVMMAYRFDEKSIYIFAIGGHYDQT